MTVSASVEDSCKLASVQHVNLHADWFSNTYTFMVHRWTRYGQPVIEKFSICQGHFFKKNYLSMSFSIQVATERNLWNHFDQGIKKISNGKSECPQPF